MNQHWQQQGELLCCDAINNRQSVYGLVQKLSKQTFHESGNAVFSGALSCALGVYWSLKEKAGFSIVNEHPALSGGRVASALKLNGMLASGETREFTSAISQAVAAVDKAAQLGMLSFPDPVQPKASESATAEPIKVEVVSMPTRSTVTTITRDGEGQIEKSSSVESDV